MHLFFSSFRLIYTFICVTTDLEVVLVHGHGDGDAEREDRRDAVTRQLDVEDEVGRLVELRHLDSCYDLF